MDGNGRVGRLLVTLLLEHWGLLHRPLLYVSLFLKRHRQAHYPRLAAVRTDGDWEGWLDFFLDGVATIADEALATAQALFAQVTADRGRVLEQPGATLTAVQVFERLPNQPVVTVSGVVADVGVTKQTVGRAIDALVAARVLVEVTGVGGTGGMTMALICGFCGLGRSCSHPWSLCPVGLTVANCGHDGGCHPRSCLARVDVA